MYNTWEQPKHHTATICVIERQRMFVYKMPFYIKHQFFPLNLNNGSLSPIATCFDLLLHGFDDNDYDYD